MNIIHIATGLFVTAIIMVLMVQAGSDNIDSQALSSFRSYVIHAREMTEAGQDPPPTNIPLPKGYSINIAGDIAVLKKDGRVVRSERIKRLKEYSGFDTRYNPPQPVFSFTSGTIKWTLDQRPHANHCGLPCKDWCGDGGMINESDYISASDRCAPYEGLATAYLRSNSVLTSEPIDASGVSSLILIFYWKGRSFDLGTEKAYAQVWDGKAWRTVACMEDDAPPSVGCTSVDDGNWHRVEVNITKYANSNLRIRFIGSPGSWDDMWVDSIILKEDW